MSFRQSDLRSDEESHIIIEISRPNDIVFHKNNSNMPTFIILFLHDKKMMTLNLKQQNKVFFKTSQVFKTCEV